MVENTEQRIQVYLAGACFTAAERQWNERLKTELEVQCEDLHFFFYLPQHQVRAYWSSGAIHAELVQGLIASQVIVANLDGPAGDDGTCWEMGFCSGMCQMAKFLGKPPTHRIFWYRTDFRRGGDSEDNVNLMMAHSAKQIHVPMPGSKAYQVAGPIKKALTQSLLRSLPLGSLPNCS